MYVCVPDMCTQMEGRASWVHLGLFFLVSLLSTLLLPTVYPRVAVPWWTLPLLALSALGSVPFLAQAPRRSIPARPAPRLPKTPPSSEPLRGKAQPPAPPDSCSPSPAAQSTSVKVTLSEPTAGVAPHTAVQGVASRAPAPEVAAVRSVDGVRHSGDRQTGGIALPAPRHSTGFAAGGVVVDGSDSSPVLAKLRPATDANDGQEGDADADVVVTAAGVAGSGAEHQDPHSHSLSSADHGMAVPVPVIAAPALWQPPAPSLGSELDALRRLMLELRNRPYVSRVSSAETAAHVAVQCPASPAHD